MNITFIAPPAAGKGALSHLIFEKYGYPHVSIGDLLRNVEDEQIKKEIEKGAFVNNETVAKLLYARLAKEDCLKGFVLDGFPRNLSQVEIYETICEKSELKNIIIVVDIPREVGEKRITGRRVCKNCGKVYNINFEESKPKVSDKCDTCGENLIQRSDDNLETYDHRYDVYVSETEPIIDYYKNSSKIYHVDGTGSLEDVFNSIDKIIKENI